MIIFEDKNQPVEEFIHERTLARNMPLLANSVRNFWNPNNPPNPVITHKPFLEASCKKYQDIDKGAKQRNIEYIEGYLEKIYELASSHPCEFTPRTETLSSFKEQYDRGLTGKRNNNPNIQNTDVIRNKIGNLIENCYSTGKPFSPSRDEKDEIAKRIEIHQKIESTLPYMLLGKNFYQSPEPKLFREAIKQTLTQWIHISENGEFSFFGKINDLFHKNWFFNMTTTAKAIGDLVNLVDQPEQWIAASIPAIHRNFNPYIVILARPHLVSRQKIPSSLSLQIHLPEDGSPPMIREPFIAEKQQHEFTEEFWKASEFYPGPISDWVSDTPKLTRMSEPAVERYAIKSTRHIHSFLTNLEDLWQNSDKTNEPRHTDMLIQFIDFIRQEKGEHQDDRTPPLGTFLNKRFFSKKVGQVLQNAAEIYSEWLENEIEIIYRRSSFLEYHDQPLGT